MAYRNRYDEYLRKRQGVLPDAKQWKAADYARISREDGDKEESDSIGTQFDIIDDYIAHNDDITFIDRYSDDGWSGTNFDRPDFMRLMEDIKKGKINCVIVKDLSRLGRNYILVGQYLEMIFPMLNIRFISVNDRIDSIKDPASINNALVSFKNVMNDEYCRDISNKVRSSLDRKRSKGEFIGSFASYGYMKDPDDHHHLIVDPVAAEVVKNIFDWFLQGMSIIGIAKRLNHMGIPNPSAYKRQCGLNYKHPAGQLDSAWPDSSVKRVLKNRLYVGDMVQNKNRTKSYKVQVSVAVPEENWVIVPNMHEAIIDREKFETVQQLLMRDTRTSPGINHVSIFAGYIRCADCLRAMGKKSVAQSYGKYHYYVCQTFRKAGRNLCTKHTIREKQLYDAVLATGHISPEEIRCVVDSARNIGVQKIVITHPEYWVVDMSLEDQQELISDYNVILERCFMQPLKNGQWISNAERNLKAIRKLGAENSILSTDCGNPATPPWEESMRQYLQFMADHNVSRDELRAMTETTPARLLGLTDVQISFGSND